jgi:hypothetical protein
MTNKTNIEEKVQERMRKIGGRKKNFILESQKAEMEGNDKIIIMQSKTDKGIQNINLILEPDKFDQLSSTIRLTFNEYCDVINELAEEEESDWAELRMKDQVNITRDAIIQATIMKYAEEEYNINQDNYSGVEISYTKRYDGEGRFLGEATIVTLTSIPMMGATVR